MLGTSIVSRCEGLVLVTNNMSQFVRAPALEVEY